MQPYSSWRSGVPPVPRRLIASTTSSEGDNLSRISSAPASFALRSFSEVEARAQDQHSHPAFTLPLAKMLILPFRKYNRPCTASKALYGIGTHSTCRGRGINNGCAPQLSFSPSWLLGFLARTTTAPAYCCLFFTAQLFSFYLKRP